MTSRERIQRVLSHQIADRVPIQDSPWSSTITRWHKEGLPEDVTPAEYFGYEMAFCGADTTPRFPVKTLQKDTEYIVATTATGATTRNHCDYSTTPEIIDWSVKKKEDWQEIKKRLKPDFTRVDWASGLAGNKTVYEEGKFVCYSGAFGYDLLQNYMKSEQLLMTMAEDPGWVKEMIMTFAELNVVMCELMIANGFKFDGAFMFNDMGYRNALLFSPDTYLKTHFEADRLVFHYFHSKGMKVFLHSCGHMKELLPMLIDAGLDCLQALEVKAGMDLVELKQQYGDRLCFMGGIDTRLYSDPDPAKFEEEIKTKFAAAKQNGGYIYHSDHSIPKDVSFQQYCQAIEVVKKYGVYEDFKEETAPPLPAASAAPAQPQKPAKAGLFGKKAPKPAAEKPAAPAPEQKPEAAPAAPAKEGKKFSFSLPFGKKK